jgi:hypothetical protein
VYALKVTKTLRYLKWEKSPGDTRRKENETGQLVEELRLLNTEWKG